MNVIADLKSFAKDLTILIAEDDSDLNSELTNLLQIFYKEVYSALDGEEALELYKKHRCDVILSDITMPKMNGIKLSTEVKNIKRDQAVVILSAHTELDYLIPLIDIGINQFVAKPFESENLLYRLLKVSEEITSSRFYEKDQGLKL